MALWNTKFPTADSKNKLEKYYNELYKTIRN